MGFGISKRLGPCYAKYGLGPVGSAALGSLLEMQKLRALPELLNQTAD